MKAIKIDADTQKIYETEISGLEDMQKAVGGLIEQATVFKNRDVVYVDEEGMLKPMFMFFTIEGGHQPFAGSGLIVGTDNMGESVDANTPIEKVKKMVKFLNIYQVKAMIAREEQNA